MEYLKAFSSCSMPSAKYCSCICSLLAISGTKRWNNARMMSGKRQSLNQINKAKRKVFFSLIHIVFSSLFLNCILKLSHQPNNIPLLTFQWLVREKHKLALTFLRKPQRTRSWRHHDSHLSLLLQSKVYVKQVYLAEHGNLKGLNIGKKNVVGLIYFYNLVNHFAKIAYNLKISADCPATGCTELQSLFVHML